TIVILTSHPTSTLFPYTTLFRSSDRLVNSTSVVRTLTKKSTIFKYITRGDDPKNIEDRLYYVGPKPQMDIPPLENNITNYQTPEIGRHTSELQSRENLVCRLLLE